MKQKLQDFVILFSVRKFTFYARIINVAKALPFVRMNCK